MSRLVSEQLSVEKGTEENGMNSSRSGSQKRLEQYQNIQENRLVLVPDI